MYLDACIEPWAGGHRDTSIPASRRTNYAFREAALAMRRQVPERPHLRADARRQPGPGLAPGQAGAAQPRQRHRRGTAGAANETPGRSSPGSSGVKVVQIAERDRQVGQRRKQWGEFVNTWSSEAFCGESLQPAELGWGTHERHWPHDGMEFGFGCGAAIYLDRPGCSTRVRSWVPTEGLVPRLADLARRGAFHPRLLHRARERQGRLPADLPLRLPSLRRRGAVAARDGRATTGAMQDRTRLLRDEIDEGFDELGVLLMGHSARVPTGTARSSPSRRRASCARTTTPPACRSTRRHWGR